MQRVKRTKLARKDAAQAVKVSQVAPSRHGPDSSRSRLV